MEYKMKKHIVMASLVVLASTSAHSAGVGLLSMILGDKNVQVQYASNSGVYSPLPQQIFFPDGRDTVYEEYYRMDDGRVVKKVLQPRGCQVAYTGNMVCLPPVEHIYYVKDIPQMPVAPGQPVTVYPTEIVPVAVQASPSPPKATRNTHVDPEEIPGKRREEIDGMPIQYGNERVGDSPCVGSSKECAKRTNSIVN
jgi:hypothetical protein